MKATWNTHRQLLEIDDESSAVKGNHESGLGRVVDGMAHRSHRIKAIGNGQVSRVRATAWRMLGGPIA